MAGVVLRTHMNEGALKWAEVLTAEDFAGGNTRRNVLARVLDQNDLTELRQLRNAPHPTKWLHGGRLQLEEVVFLLELCNKQRVQVLCSLYLGSVMF